MALDIGRPFGGFLSFYNILSFDGEEYINGGNPPWWPAIAGGKITYQDRIATINNEKYRTPDVAEIYERLWEQGQRFVELYLWRPGGHETVIIPIRQFALEQYLEISVANFLVGLGYWLMALVIYRGQPFEPLNRITALLAAASAGYGGTTPNSLFGNGVGNVLEIVSFLSLGLIAPAAIHLALRFPRPVALSLPSKPGSAASLVLKLLYAAGLGLALFYVISKILYWNGVDVDVAEALDRSAFYSIYPYLGIAYLFFSGRLLIAAFKDPSPRHRRESALLFFGMGGCFLPMYFLVGRTLPFSLSSSYWGTLHLNYLLLAVPIALCLIILRYKTFRPLPALFMIAPLLMISALLATAQTTAAVSSNLVPDSKGIYLFLTGFTLVFFSSSLWNFQSSWQGFFRRLLQWERTTLEDIKRFGQGMLAEQDLAALPSATAPALCRHLRLERAAVWVWHEQAFELVSQAGLWLEPLPFYMGQTTLPDRPLRLTRLTRKPGIPLYDRNEVEVLVPLWVTADSVGLLALGKRWDEAVFDERDLDTIALIGQQVALFLLSARQIERLRQVPQQLSDVQERERNRLAQEIHDTTEQFLGRLPFTLEEVRTELLDDAAKAGKLIQQCLEEINQEARTLRRIRHEMAPIQLEHGFTAALERLVESFRIRTRLSCDLSLPDDFEGHLPAQARLPLYRVIQQALDNISEHARASQVEIALAVEAERINFRITDNGRGSMAEERVRAQSKGSFGLTSMSARIENLGGDFRFESAVGKGTVISGWVPRTSKQ
jgi:signal transduction histidine kinase